MSANKIRNEFNRTAEKLGCRARLSGTAKSPKFEMWTGEVTHDGFEVVVGITVGVFCRMIGKYPELRD